MSVPETIKNKELKATAAKISLKRHSRCLKLHRSYSMWLNLSLKCLRIFLELSSKGLGLSLHEEKENRCPVFTFSMKREILWEKLGSFTS